MSASRITTSLTGAFSRVTVTGAIGFFTRVP
jgi:hypothetical protein